MPGIDQRTQSFKNQSQSATRAEKHASNLPTIRQSVAANNIVQANTEKKVEQNIERQEINNNLQIQKNDQEKNIHNIKQQKNIQSDGFQKANAQSVTKSNLSVSQYAAEIKDKKERQKETQTFAQNINNAQIGQLRTKLNNPHSRSSAEEIQTTSVAAQAHLDAIDPDHSQEEKRAHKLLQEIHDRGGDKGKGFAAFAHREVNKGRLDEIIDLIEGYHKTLKGTSLTAVEMVQAGQEPLLTVKNMISASNQEELKLLNQQISARPDVSAGFKRDQMAVRNRSGLNRVAPPSFCKPIKTNKLDDAVRFISTIHNTVLSAPWDKLA